MSERIFDLQPKEDISYFGNSDLIGQITDQLRNCPDSCFSQNVFAWYNASYEALTNSEDCSYQVNADRQLCADLYGEPGEGDITVGEAFDFIVSTAVAVGRRDGRRLLLNFCRLARRALIEQTSQTVE